MYESLGSVIIISEAKMGVTNSLERKSGTNCLTGQR